MSGNKKIVEIRHFKMKFGDKTVIKDLSFDVFQGEVFGFLGSNGSGKTTTLRALLGLYEPAAGDLLINGRPYAVENRLSLGYLPEERGLYKKEKVLDVMIYFGQLKGLNRNEAKEFSLKFLERVGLSDKANMRLDKLSGGQQQKIQLGVTIMGDPELLIMDEPTKGFDPVNRRLLMNIIEEQRKAGTTIIYVTHQMEEVEQLCDRLILLKDGQAAAYGTLAEVKKQFGGASMDDIFVKVYGGEDKELGDE
jgi:ABC transporter, ATP-binding protein